jgi:hypothetical protein
VKYLLFLIIFILFSNTFTVNARSPYFIHKNDRKILTDDEEVGFEIKYDLIGTTPDRFSVRPRIKNGIVSIWNEGKGIYTQGNDNWSRMPKLDNKMYFKLEALGSGKTEMWFEVRDTHAGKVYETPVQSIWSRYVYEEYVDKLNQNIIMWVGNGKIPE